VLAAHEVARHQMIKRTRRDWTPFKLGQKVWLEATNLKLPYPSDKIAPKRLGLFTIAKEVRTRAYQLDLPERWNVHNVFHATLLTPFKETEAHGPAFLKPPPDVIDGEEEWEVERILAHRKRGRGYQYLVHFKGYSNAEDKWLPAKNLENSSEMLDKYKQDNNL
jgi:Chromo (CHRromatin Organisation MOdifier) domain